MPAPTLRAAIALTLSLFATCALAQVALAQASINDCEKIQAADAYNQCLAKFGPETKTQNLAPERPGDVKNNSEEAAAGAGRFSPGAAASPRATVRGGRGMRRHGTVRRAYGGRKRMVFTVRRRHR